MPLLTREARADIQGLITTAYGHLPDAAFLFVNFPERAAAKQWLGRLAGELTTAVSWRASPSEPKRKPSTATNVALTHAGFGAAGLSERALNSFSREFQFGMAARADVLGDVGPSGPSEWDFGWPAEPLHAVLMLYGADPETLDWHVARHQQQIDARQISVIAYERGHRFEPAYEQFGFSDGIAQPEIEGVRTRLPPGQPVIPTGEFILGYPNAYGSLPSTIGVPVEDHAAGVLPPFPEQPAWRDLGRNGTYMVFRKLAQDVAGFWTFLQHEVEQSPPPAAEKEMATLRLGAKFVGRWRSGAPITLAPEHDDPELGADKARNNDFAFMESDADGFACPFGSHIRRMNPRDSLSNDSPADSIKTSDRHRIVRRGIPYGTRLLDDTVLDVEDDGVPRGLHFIAVATDLKRQFEFVQAQWLNNPRFDGLFADRDPVVGSGESGCDMTVQQQLVRRTIRDVPAFVTTRGGGYFFLPSVTAVRFLGT